MPELNERAPLLDETLKAGNVSATQTYAFTASLFEKQGTAHLGWSQNCPARLQDCWIALYKNSFPVDPNNGHVAWTWVQNSADSYDTKQPWGSGWCAALVAKNGAGQWVYVVKTPVTG